MVRILILSWMISILLVTTALAEESRSRIFTLWPLLDYRASTEPEYRNFSLLGPLFEFTQTPAGNDFQLRPFYSRTHSEDRTYREWLYPVASRESGEEKSYLSILGLVTRDAGEVEAGSENEFMLFPFLFWRDNDRPDDYFAFFPFWGEIKDKYNRDLIRFRLFPLYSRTYRGETRTSNYLWPFFARIEGPEETGVKFWPLYGQSSKSDSYRKLFLFWPIYFNYDLKLGTEDETRYRALFPLWSKRESASFEQTFYLWPFFSHTRDEKKGYDQWHYPWPLLGHSRGEYKEGVRVLPFYSDEKIGKVKKRWILWPLFKRELASYENYESRRHRVLFFLFDRLEEYALSHQRRERSLLRVSFWPFMTYRVEKGVYSLHFLSLLEPFFPENEKIERNWSPFWRLYQRRWDKEGNEAISIFWNLYWMERRGTAKASELFPLYRYRRGAEGDRELELLKGLLRFRSREGERGTMRLFYLPWEIPLFGQAIDEHREMMRHG